MQFRALGWLALASTLLFSVGSDRRGAGPAHQQATEHRTAVLVELFTSEGCSSCPPADALLAQLENSGGIAGAEIMALKQHVDYWNRLGWTDRFSSPAFSRRQSEHAESFGRGGSVYTPQMIVDGQEEFVGSDEDKARRAIERASRTSKARVQIELLSEPPTTSGVIHLRVQVVRFPDAAPDGAFDLFLAITESNLSSQITRGENAGRRLEHTAVVRDLRKIAIINPSQELTTDLQVPLESAWKIKNLRAVVFIQRRRNRQVLGAAQSVLLSNEKAAAGGTGHVLEPWAPLKWRRGLDLLARVAMKRRNGADCGSSTSRSRELPWSRAETGQGSGVGRGRGPRGY